MKKIHNMLILMICVLISGCMNIQTRVLDDIQLATAVGYEYVDEDTIQITSVFPNYQPDKSVKNETLTSRSILSKEIRSKHSLQSDKPLVSGKIEVALYEKKTAEAGIKDLIDSLQRDPSIGSNVYLLVSDGSPKEVLSKQYGDMDNGIFLSNLIEHNIESGLIPETNLHLYLYKYYAEGMDPALPIIEKKEGKVNVKAIGLFNKDKLVDQIEQREFFIFKILLQRKSNHESYALQLKEGEKASVFNVSSKRKYHIPDPMTNSEIKISLKIKSIIREYSDGELTKDKIKEIERGMEEEIKKKAEEMIKKFQEKSIDPLGIGEQVRTRTRKWDQKKWEELYPDIKISIQPKVEILETGVIE